MSLKENLINQNEIVGLAANAKFNFDLYNFLSKETKKFDFSTYKNLRNVWNSYYKKLMFDSDKSGDPVKDLLSIYSELESEWVKSHPEFRDSYIEYTNQLALSESFMTTRAGALGEVFGEPPPLSVCCQSEIINNNVCSNCNKETTEMQNESLNEMIIKIKNIIKYV